MNFTETEEQLALRQAVAELGGRYGYDYTRAKIRAGAHTDELWAELGKLGFSGSTCRSAYGGGGAGIYELALVLEELSAAGCSQLMMVVSPAICGTDHRQVRHRRAEAALAARHRRRLDDHGLRHHRTRRRLQLAQASPRPPAATAPTGCSSGRKIYVTGVDRAEAVLIVARTEDAQTGRLKPALFAFPTDTPGFEYRAIDMDVAMTDRQFLLFLDDVRLPADALIGDEDAALAQLFAGLNPERIMAAAVSSAPAATHSARPSRTPTSAPCGASRSARTRASPTRSPRPRSSSSWPS